MLTREYMNEYLGYLEQLDGDEAGRRAAWARMQASTAIYNGQVIFSSYLPKLYDTATKTLFEQTAERIYGILRKVIAHYREDAAYRARFGYDPRLEELILLPRPYDCEVPFCRLDLFHDEETGDITFCEFNTDGSSGMNENREVTRSIVPSEPFRRFAAKHIVHDHIEPVFEGWVQAFLNLYASRDGAVGHPNIAIVDFLENSVLEEFKIYAKLFEEAGYRFGVYDIRNLTLEHGRLIGHNPFLGPDGMAIDVAWRRSMSTDIVLHWDESTAYLDALRTDAVTIIGPYDGHIPHDKRIFIVLRDPMTKAILTPEENAFIERTIPWTAYLTSDLPELADIKANPHDWIIKPVDGFGSQSVYAGPSYEPDEWAAIVDAHLNDIDRSGLRGLETSTYLVQRYCHPYRSPAIPFYNHEEDYTAAPQSFANLHGLYLVRGKLAGVFLRQGPNPIILGRYGGVTAATFWVED